MQESSDIANENRKSLPTQGYNSASEPECDIYLPKKIMKVQQVRNTHVSAAPWSNIFAICKLVLSIRHFSDDLCIRFVDSNFLENFRYTSEQITNHCIEKLAGPGTSRDMLCKIKYAIECGETICTFINLYRQDGVPLSSYVTSLVMSNSLPKSIEEYNILQGDNCAETIAVLTIRSASVVGNALSSGYGLLGRDICKDAKQEILEYMLSSSTSQCRS